MLAALPGSVVLALLWLGDLLTPTAFALGVVLTVALAAVIARSRAREAAAVGEWVGELAGPGPILPPPDRDFALDWLHHPVLELARRIRGLEERGESQRRLLESIVESLPDPILIVDKDLAIRFANPPAQRVFSISRDNVPLGRALRDPGVLAAVNSAFLTGAASTVTFNPVNEREKQFAARISRVDLADGIDGALIALREQTEQVIIERMRSDFVANASHEIRTPLASIIGFIETLRGPAKDDAEARDMFLATMAEETARMARLVDDLLVLSRIELTVNLPLATFIDPRAALVDVVRRLQQRAGEQGVRLEFSCADELPSVRADPDQLEQLVVNLVDNAIKYGKRPGTVRIEALSLDRAPDEAGPVSARPCVAISVIDQGDGIPDEHIPRLTERFYRVDSARARRLGGTGLGLAIVKHILRRHQGYLRVESEIGVGSTFSILLPVEDPPAAVT